MRLLWPGAVVLALAGLAAGCANRTPSAPPGREVASGAYTPGGFVWQDLVTDDVARCRRFYGSLLGWQFEESTRRGHPYVLVVAGGQRVAGIVAVDREDPEAPVAQWISYVSVPDVDAAVAAVESAGGRRLVGPVEVDDAGRAAVVADPQGAPIGLARLAGGDPPDRPPLVGRFFWREYLAEDAGAALSFYQGLLGYESQAEERRAGLVYHVLRRDGRSRAGLFRIPRNIVPGDRVKPNWLPYVRVDDPAALAARVGALGGAIVLEPRQDVRGGTLAIVADPTGAALALQKWPVGEETRG